MIRPKIRFGLLSSCRERPLLYRHNLPPLRRYSPYPKEGVFQSASSSPRTPTLPPSPLEQQQQQQNHQYKDVRYQRRRWRPRWYNVMAAVLVSAAGGFMVYSIPLSSTKTAQLLLAEIADKELDQERYEHLFAQLDELPVVQSVRDAWVMIDGKRQPVWREWTAYSSLSGDIDRRDQRLTTGPLGTHKGVKCQKVFYDEERKQLLVFVMFGPSVCDNFGTVHNGIVTTICDEALGRLAIKDTEEKSAVTAYLDCQFHADIVPLTWYAVIVNMHPHHASTDRKKYTTGAVICAESAPNLDETEDAHIHATVDGLFVVPANVKLAALPDDF